MGAVPFTRSKINQLFRYAVVDVPGLEQNPASDLDVAAVPGIGSPMFPRLSPLLPRPDSEPIAEPVVSNVQRERQEMLAVHEAPHVLPVSAFAKLAGKSKDQINREIKAK